MARAVLLLPLVFLLAAPSHADDVRLRNGKVFEGVIAEERGDTVLVRIPGGSLSLARASVREIVRSASPYAEYLDRVRALRAANAGAADWLALARWARDHELDTAVREAALEAAALEPKLAGLAPLLRGLGYELETSENRWLPLAEVMKRRGLVLADGRWMSRQEAVELARHEAEEARLRRQARDAERVERAAAEARLAAAELELARAYAPPPTAAVVVVPSAFLWPVAVFPGFPAPPLPFPDHPDRPRRHEPRPRDSRSIDMRIRQPGSLFPGELDLSSSSTSSKR